MSHVSKEQKKYNHAFAISFSVDSDMTEAEWLEYMRTRQGLSELGAHVIRRAMQVVQDGEPEAYDYWDSYEH